MKNHLRLALPRLAVLEPDSLLAFVLLDRTGQILRAGELPLNQLAGAVPSAGVYAILHPDDVVIVTLSVPPLSGNRLDQAIESLVEAMALSDTETLCIAHGPRQDNGSAVVTWTDRAPLLRAWQLMAAAGLNILGLTPQALALPADDAEPHRPLALPADQRWCQPLPKWSFARSAWRPASDQRRWHQPLAWASAALLVWLLGLNLYATQRSAEVLQLSQGIEQNVRRAFPDMTAIIDPLRQAENARDALRLAHGTSGADDFIPLALAAARVFSGAEGKVTRMRYERGELWLSFNEGFTPPPEVGLNQAAAAQRLDIRRDDTLEHTWIIRRVGERGRGSLS